MDIYYDPETDISLQVTFNKIWKKYYRKVTLFCRGILRGEDNVQDDIAQEVMLKIFKNMANYNRKYSLSTWIYTIARNTCLDHKRKKTINAVYLEEGRIKSKYGSPDEELRKKETEKIIKSYIRKLGEDDSQVVFLRFYENMKIREISRITGIPEGTVKYKIHNIKKGLKEYLTEADYVN
jgi:RNA polymerase sigma-70 factor (ECF subfamily)